MTSKPRRIRDARSVGDLRGRRGPEIRRGCARRRGDLVLRFCWQRRRRWRWSWRLILGHGLHSGIFLFLLARRVFGGAAQHQPRARTDRCAFPRLIMDAGTDQRTRGRAQQSSIHGIVGSLRLWGRLDGRLGGGLVVIARRGVVIWRVINIGRAAAIPVAVTKGHICGRRRRIRVAGISRTLSSRLTQHRSGQQANARADGRVVARKSAVMAIAPGNTADHRAQARAHDRIGVEQPLRLS